jgi:hypothetical protein
MATFQIQIVSVNESGTGRGHDLKMEILSKVSCEQ